jgi:ornithine cyclodeaminase/alanine dehydrogenase-like protein (mu-crystallin family)
VSGGTLILTRRDVSELLDLDACIAAVEEAFRLEGEGRVPRAGILGFPLAGGGFHIKAAALDLNRSYFAAKVNGNFPGNRERFGLPTIQGVVILCDAGNGSPLALIDSMEITSLRTAAATAVAAKSLARPDSRVAAICGGGRQGRAQLAAIYRVLPLRKAFVFDTDLATAQTFACEMEETLGIEVVIAAGPAQALAGADVGVTSTPSRRPFLKKGDLKPGVFLAAVGADASEKQELDPELLAGARVVVDVLEQCATIGELHHALEAKQMTRSDVSAELAEIVSGRKPGRQTLDEIVIFDSTGTALEDVAAAVAVYERAVAAGRGASCDLAV